jgi:hypothetical protein
MNDGLSFLGLAGLLLLGLLWLAAYLYGLYRLARHFGRRFRSVRHPFLPYATVVVAGAMLASLVAWLPFDPFTRFCFGLIAFVAHVHPFFVGVWTANEAARREDHQKWAERTEEWLSDWERSPTD